jgi:hypothetical protein
MAPLTRVLVTLLLAAPAAAAAQAPPGERLQLYAYTCQHRRAADISPLVADLLTPRGEVSLAADGRSLQVRDTPASVRRVQLLLRSLDQEVIALDVEVMVVRARRMAVSPHDVTIPPELEGRLPVIPPYNHYELVALANLASREEEEVTYEMGEGYALRFRVGRLDLGAVRLENFQLLRRDQARPMFHANLNLRLDETYRIGFSKSESSPTALMLVLTSRHRPVLLRQAPRP